MNVSRLLRRLVRPGAAISSFPDWRFPGSANAWRSGAVVEHRSARGPVFRLRYADASGRRVCETLGLKAEGWTQRRAEQALSERLVDVKREG